jgi:hypothetical protein
MPVRLASYFLLLLFVNCGGQTKTLADKKFTFWTSSLINDTAHEVMTYYVTKDSIIVKQGAGWNFLERNKIRYSSIFTSQEKADIDSLATTLNKASFKSFYYNPCIIHGVTHEFSFNWEDHTKRTTLSNYYLDDVNAFVNFINKKIPKEFKILYDKEKLQTDLKNCSSTQ